MPLGLVSSTRRAWQCPVVFLDGDKTNFKPNNIDVREKGKSSIRRRKAYLEDRIREMEDELDEINAQLEN